MLGTSEGSPAAGGQYPMGYMLEAATAVLFAFQGYKAKH